jgi:glycerol-3-phosphate acyltransferase PlsY
MMFEWLLIPAAYLLGSVSSAIIVCKIMGLQDPREQGSKNPGATNVMRLGGKKAAAITLLGDMLKGLIPVLIAKFEGGNSAILALVGVAAFFGHLYPIFFGFKGGKGVATSLGVLSGYSWVIGGLVLGTWVLIYKLFKISSLSALVAAVLVPFYVWFISGNIELVGATILISGVLIWRHKKNIQQLIKGTET